jgi:hypothetical protein
MNTSFSRLLRSSAPGARPHRNYVTTRTSGELDSPCISGVGGVVGKTHMNCLDNSISDAGSTIVGANKLTGYLGLDEILRLCAVYVSRSYMVGQSNDNGFSEVEV